MSIPISNSTQNEYAEKFEKLKENQFKVASTTVGERKAKLKKLYVAIESTYREAIRTAMMADFGKPPTEVDMNEILPITSEIKHVIAHLSNWMGKQRVSTPLSLLGSTSYYQYEPKGVCLIISPWNFPFNLTFGPLISAIAAGNTVMLKPSELTPHSSAVMLQIVNDLYPENEICLIEGGVEVSTQLLELPFNHIFFTGSPNIGKVVMSAAAKHLSSVTLELGGKSPTIVDETANIKSAAKLITWGKFLNSGQICIAPDYVFVHESKKDLFLGYVKENIKTFFGDNPLESDSYGAIVNQKHNDRVIGYINDAVKLGATLETGGSNGTKNRIAPTVLTKVPIDSSLMQNEIFGPVMPVFTYQHIDEVLNFINAREKPLALYIYTASNKKRDYILKNTRAGGTAINNNVVHYFNSNLPFGGSNNSGIGKSHGFFGFQAFSDARGVYEQIIPSALEFFMPPYNNLKSKLVQLAIKCI
ncbi:MAG: aldehyde dehydrogenase family protein [Saprospiraceae bacterium]